MRSRKRWYYQFPIFLPAELGIKSCKDGANNHFWSFESQALNRPFELDFFFQRIEPEPYYEQFSKIRPRMTFYGGHQTHLF